jgi:CRISPR-associated protein Csb3
VLRLPKEYCKGKSDYKKSVEPFYFDARRFVHPLDTGFSLDKQDAETIAYPAVELLCLIGLQRFRPAATPMKWSFDYWPWPWPLTPPVAAAVFSGFSPVPGRQTHRFRLRFRDDQKRYKAFDFAISVGGDS